MELEQSAYKISETILLWTVYIKNPNLISVINELIVYYNSYIIHIYVKIVSLTKMQE